MPDKTPKDGVSGACVFLAATRTATPEQNIVLEPVLGQSTSR